MRVIGITGGIACGKTYVTDYLKEVGEQVIDVDKINRDLLFHNSECIAEVKKQFPSCIVMTDNFRIKPDREVVDREALKKIVFNDYSQLYALTRIMREYIVHQVNIELVALGQSGTELVFYSHPLLFKQEEHHRCHNVIVIHCNAAFQIARLVEREKFTAEEAMNRIKLQQQVVSGEYPFVKYIDTGGDGKSTNKQVMRMLANLYINK